MLGIEKLPRFEVKRQSAMGAAIFINVGFGALADNHETHGVVANFNLKAG
jgi:hypothetical protein